MVTTFAPFQLVQRYQSSQYTPSSSRTEEQVVSHRFSACEQLIHEIYGSGILVCLFLSLCHSKSKTQLGFYKHGYTCDDKIPYAQENFQKHLCYD